MPTPIPAVFGASTKALTASVVAVHLVGGGVFPGALSHWSSDAGQYIEIDLSTMTKRSVTIGVLSRASLAQAASAFCGVAFADPPPPGDPESGIVRNPVPLSAPPAPTDAEPVAVDVAPVDAIPRVMSPEEALPATPVEVPANVERVEPPPQPSTAPTRVDRRIASPSAVAFAFLRSRVLSFTHSPQQSTARRIPWSPVVVLPAFARF